MSTVWTERGDVFLVVRFTHPERRLTDSSLRARDRQVCAHARRCVQNKTAGFRRGRYHRVPGLRRHLLLAATSVALIRVVQIDGRRLTIVGAAGRATNRGVGEVIRAVRFNARSW